MTKEQQDVKDWMIKFRQEAPDKPTIPSIEIRKLRAKLILEEALETIRALGCNVGVDDGKGIQTKEIQVVAEFHSDFIDLVKIADGLADLHYVGYCGTAVACGIDMEPIFAEIHRSNMSKLWTEQDVSDLTLEERVKCSVKKISKYDFTKYLVKNQDGKVIKSPSYSPANIKPLLLKQGATNLE